MDYRKSLQVQAYEYIKELICEGKLEYNEIYSETKIARELGISRTPMRDAIQHLSQERYIDIMPNKGFVLHQMSMDDFMQTNQIRIALEGYSARQIAAEDNTEKKRRIMEKLRELLSIQLNVIDQSVKEFLEADKLFHQAIVNYIENAEINNLFDSYMYRMNNLAYNSLLHDGRMKMAYEEHYKIYDDMKDGRDIEVYLSIIKHMENPKNISIR